MQQFLEESLKALLQLHLFPVIHIEKFKYKIPFVYSVYLRYFDRKKQNLEVVYYFLLLSFRTQTSASAALNLQSHKGVTWWLKDKFVSMMNVLIFSYFKFSLLIPYLSVLSQCTRVPLLRSENACTFIVHTLDSSTVIYVLPWSYILF